MGLLRAGTSRGPWRQICYILVTGGCSLLIS
jgi:hypothetical protein